jgi:Ca2+-binding EF-hand superfamily protein
MKITFILQPFFVERAFRIFDCDGNGTVSMGEFIDTMHQFAGQSSDEKLVFLFRVYDLDGTRFFYYSMESWVLIISNQTIISFQTMA